MGCHSTYMVWPALAGPSKRSPSAPRRTPRRRWTYNAAMTAAKVRHKHPINVPLSNYNGPDKASFTPRRPQVLPLANQYSAERHSHAGGGRLDRVSDLPPCARHLGDHDRVCGDGTLAGTSTATTCLTTCSLHPTRRCCVVTTGAFASSVTTSKSRRQQRALPTCVTLEGSGETPALPCCAGPDCASVGSALFCSVLAAQRR